MKNTHSKLGQSYLAKNFQKLREKVLAKRPILKEIIFKRGSKNLYNYAKEYIDINLNPPIQRRQDELLSTLYEEVSKRLGEEVARFSHPGCSGELSFRWGNHYSPSMEERLYTVEGERIQ